MNRIERATKDGDIFTGAELEGNGLIPIEAENEIKKKRKDAEGD